MDPDVLPHIRAAAPADMVPIRTLLGDADLPVEGVAELEDLSVALDTAGAVIACAGLEVYGSAGLLRSVAVTGSQRGRGIGAVLVQHMIERAAALGLRRIYLLTETAAPFFARAGFRPIDRDAVDDAVQASDEFSRLCPATAEVMVHDLPGG
jgi:amino-acid N-acetyltransferase